MFFSSRVFLSSLTLFLLFLSHFTYSKPQSDALNKAPAPGFLYGLPLDRPLTLRQAFPAALENEYHFLTHSPKASSFIYPRLSIYPFLDSNHGIGHPSSDSILPHPNNKLTLKGVKFSDQLYLPTGIFGYHKILSQDNGFLALYPVLGIESRGEALEGVFAEKTNRVPTQAFDIGLQTYGSRGPFGFFLDGRIFTEIRDTLLPDRRAFDREFLETQNKDNSGSLDYTSYARYRSIFSLRTSIGDFLLGHDSPHWGPGLFTNLSFHQGSIPFDYVQYSTRLGPFRVASLYGRLQLDHSARFQKSSDFRSLYAHRYEWMPFDKLTIGISEQLVFFNHEEPWAFAPLVPLFMHKGLNKESFNNGNIAFDFSYKIIEFIRVYSEFLIDDLQAPSSLFNDYWGNRWAWMCGAHIAWLHQPQMWGGSIVEYSRIEPYVYMHYDSLTAQSANAGYPLGNQFGPNSQAIILKHYLRLYEKFYFSLKTDFIWKGKGYGSNLVESIYATPELESSPKKFIDGINRPNIEQTVGLAWKNNFLSIQGSLIFGDFLTWNLRFQFN